MKQAELLAMVDGYVASVLNGQRNAGRLERLMVERHVNDLKKGVFIFDRDEVVRILTITTMLRHTAGSYAGKHFNLQPFQAFILASLFGWKKEDGFRRYRRSYMEIARKNGKSELAAAVSVIMLVFCNEPGAQIYSAATTRDQASIVFKAAKEMIRMLSNDSQSIANLVRIYQHSITGPMSSIMKAIASNASKLDGLNPYGASVDEMHEHPTNEVYQVLVTGSGSRDEPLTNVTTTAGFNIQGPCYQLRSTCVQILDGILVDEAQFVAIYTIDEDDDWQDERCWDKPNPNIGQTPSWDFMRGQLQAAVNEGYTTQTQFLTKNLNVWMRASKVWIPAHVWNSCEASYTLADLKGMTCYAGLDLSATQDITALVLFFPTQKGLVKPRLLSFNWLPEDRVYARKLADGVPYPDWVASGHVTPTDGNVIDYKLVASQTVEILSEVNCISLAYDRLKNSVETVILLEESDVVTLPWSQHAANMTQGCEALQMMAVGGQIEHDGNPVLRWNIGNVTIKTYPDGTIKIDKSKSTEKVDGAVAAAMAIGNYLKAIADDSRAPSKVSKYATQAATVIKPN
jgi:phage terminase large subunit-like protein